MWIIEYNLSSSAFPFVWLMNVLKLIIHTWFQIQHCIVPIQRLKSKWHEKQVISCPYQFPNHTYCNTLRLSHLLYFSTINIYHHYIISHMQIKTSQHKTLLKLAHILFSNGRVMGKFSSWHGNFFFNYFYYIYLSHSV